MNSGDALRNGYDAFISHNRADKAWARELADQRTRRDFGAEPLLAFLAQNRRKRMHL